VSVYEGTKNNGVRRQGIIINNKPSEPMAIKGSQKYKRAYTEIFRSEDEYKRYTASPQSEKINIYYGSGAVYGVKNHSKSHKRNS
jgi:hypothetical protein